MKTGMAKRSMRLAFIALLALFAALAFAGCGGGNSVDTPRALPPEGLEEGTRYFSLRFELDVPKKADEREPQSALDLHAAENIYPLLYAALSDGKEISAKNLPKSGGRCRFEITIQSVLLTGREVITITGWDKNIIRWNSYMCEIDPVLPSGDLEKRNFTDYYAKISKQSFEEITAYLKTIPTDLGSYALDNILASNNDIPEDLLPLQSVQDTRLLAPLHYWLNPPHGNAPAKGKIIVNDESAAAVFYEHLNSALQSGQPVSREAVDFTTAKCYFIMSPDYPYGFGGTDLNISGWEGNVLYWQETVWSDVIMIDGEGNASQNYWRNGCYVQLSDEAIADLIAAARDLEQYQYKDSYDAPVFRQD
ncbi:MAG: hypothetical protein LBO63_03820 [Oscillospiraceae bacterium]|jgi:hypothetical protein|nr:hypothetical protein [Oscillospiraceae bacterium]